MKISRCRSCKKFVDKDVFGQSEAWPCLGCDAEVCVNCYVTHTQLQHSGTLVLSHETPKE